MTTTSSTGSLPTAIHCPTTATRCSRLGLKNRCAMARASAPDTRTTPMPLRPGGVAIATIVSSEETIFCNPSRIRSALLRFFRFCSSTEFCFGVGRPIFIDEDLLNDADDVTGQPVQNEAAALGPEHEGENKG